MRVFYYPEFKSNDELNDQVNRASWYLSCVFPFSVTFFTRGVYSYKERDEFSYKLKEMVSDSFKAGVFKLEKLCSIESLDVRRGDIVILWKDKGDLNDNELTKLKRMSSIAKLYDVNSSRRMEGSLYIEISREYYKFDSSLIEMSNNKFETLKSKYNSIENSFIFCTGPSIKNYKLFTYDSSLKIICNSVINDDDFMEYIKPDILTFGDPIFHFGCSSYAQAFRDKLLKSAELYSFDIVIPIKYYPIFSFYFPELIERTIPLPYSDIENFNVDLSNEFLAKTTDNILTFMMLPLATSLSSNVFIMGCDGRPLDENDYFWKHNNKTQFSDEMDSIKLAHPSFFKLEYNEYYLRHCDNLELFFKKSEQLGKRFCSLGFSYIPALINREYEYKEFVGAGKKTFYISVNPDLKDSFGHFLHYDMRIFDTLDNGEDLLSLGSKELSILDSPYCIQPVFSRNTWNLRSFDLSPHYQVFKGELASELRLISLINREICVYIYPGSMQFYALVIDLISLYPELRKINFKINVFYTHMDYSALYIPNGKGHSYYLRLLTLYKEIKSEFNQVELFSDSIKLKSLISKDFGVDLGFWPMISVTNIAEINRYKINNSNYDGDCYRILFPGTGQLAKGYDLICQLILSYEKQPIINGKKVIFIIRDQFRDSEVNNLELKINYNKVVLLPWVEVIKGNLSEPEYFKCFHEASIVLLPYRVNNFHTRTSGCLVDAFNFDKPVVVFSDTWLGDVVCESGFGELAVDGDIDSIKESIYKLAGKGSSTAGCENKFCPTNLKKVLKYKKHKENNLSFLVLSKINSVLKLLFHSDANPKTEIVASYIERTKRSNSKSYFSDLCFRVSGKMSTLLMGHPFLHKVFSKIWHRLKMWL